MGVIKEGILTEAGSIIRTLTAQQRPPLYKGQNIVPQSTTNFFVYTLFLEKELFFTLVPVEGFIN